MAMTPASQDKGYTAVGTVVSNGTKTYQQALNELYALIDDTVRSHRNTLAIIDDNNIYLCTRVDATQVIFSRFRGATGMESYVYTAKSSGSTRTFYSTTYPNGNDESASHVSSSLTLIY